MFRSIIVLICAWVSTSSFGAYQRILDEQIVLMRDVAILHGRSLEELLTMYEFMRDNDQATRSALGDNYDSVTVALRSARFSFQSLLDMMESFVAPDDESDHVSVAEIANGGSVIDNIARSLLESLQRLNATIPSDAAIGEPFQSVKTQISGFAKDWKRMSVRAKVSMYYITESMDQMIAEESIHSMMLTNLLLGQHGQLAVSTSTPFPEEFAQPVTTPVPANKQKRKKKKSVRAATAIPALTATITTLSPETTTVASETTSVVAKPTEVIKVRAATTAVPVEVSDAESGEWTAVVATRVKAPKPLRMRRARPTTTTTGAPVTVTAVQEPTTYWPVTTSTVPTTTAFNTMIPAESTSGAPHTTTTEPISPVAAEPVASTTAVPVVGTTIRPMTFNISAPEFVPRQEAAAPVVRHSPVAPYLARLCELSRQAGAIGAEMAAVCDYAAMSFDHDSATLTHLAQLRQMVNVMFQNGAILDAHAHHSLAAFQPYLFIPTTPAP